mmetsp:Transcript_3931/g.11526  ORF Transcript_3931/g.11526 Transcript_3931/m.11526 type:complete len:273 (-) Transcript_3931:103-921(-)
MAPSTLSPSRPPALAGSHSRAELIARCTRSCWSLPPWYETMDDTLEVTEATEAAESSEKTELWESQLVEGEGGAVAEVGSMSDESEAWLSRALGKGGGKERMSRSTPRSTSRGTPPSSSVRVSRKSSADKDTGAWYWSDRRRSADTKCASDDAGASGSCMYMACMMRVLSYVGMGLGGAESADETESSVSDGRASAACLLGFSVAPEPMIRRRFDEDWYLARYGFSSCFGARAADIPRTNAGAVSGLPGTVFTLRRMDKSDTGCWPARSSRP